MKLSYLYMPMQGTVNKVITHLLHWQAKAWTETPRQYPSLPHFPRKLWLLISDQHPLPRDARFGAFGSEMRLVHCHPFGITCCVRQYCHHHGNAVRFTRDFCQCEPGVHDTATPSLLAFQLCSSHLGKSNEYLHHHPMVRISPTTTDIM